MDQKCISLILFYSVVCGIGAYIPHRYHFVNENKTWTEAQTYCREKYTDLATINNMGEMKKLNNTLKKETAKGAWIGLKKYGTGKWQWSFYKVGDTYTNWHSGEPNNYEQNEFCANMAKDGSWYNCGCDTQLPFVCYEEENTDNNKYILINNNIKTWYNAQTYCRENHTDLFSVRNQTENYQIMGKLKNLQIAHAWIGLFYDSWKWSDQSNSSFRYWSFNKPSGGLNCAAVSESEQHYWSNVDCTGKLPFICHENKLVLINQSLTWKQALIYCRTHHDDLFSATTEEMQLWVKEVARNSSTEHVWLGLRRTCTLGFWFWMSGEIICYQNWATGNGTGFEDCTQEERAGAVQTGGQQKWISLPQSYKLNFICSTYKG